MPTTVEEHVLSVRLPTELHEQLRRFAFDRRVAQVEIIREALRRYFEEETT